MKDERLFVTLGLYLDKNTYAEYQKSLAIPSKIKQLAQVVYHLSPQWQDLSMPAASLLELMQTTDAIRRSERFMQAVTILGHLHQGRPQHLQEQWQALLTAVQMVKPDQEWLQSKKNQISDLLRTKRQETIQNWQKNRPAE